MSSINVPEPKKVLISELKSDGKNPNVMSAGQLTALKRNIEKYGFLVPVITNKDLVIADGEHRVKAAKEIGINEIPVIVLDIEEPDRQIIRQVMNKLKGTHDYELDVILYQELIEAGKQDDLIALTGISEKEIGLLLNKFEKEYKEVEFTADISTSHECPSCGYKW